jgi:hypothetical protein
MDNGLRKAFLDARLQMASHNLLCYSANYAMTMPKVGHETEWAKSAKEVAELQDWLKEYELVDVYEKDGEISIKPYQHWNQNDRPSMLRAGWEHHGTMTQKQAEEFSAQLDEKQNTIQTPAVQMER